MRQALMGLGMNLKLPTQGNNETGPHGSWDESVEVDLHRDASS